MLRPCLMSRAQSSLNQHAQIHDYQKKRVIREGVRATVSQFEPSKAQNSRQEPSTCLSEECSSRTKYLPRIQDKICKVILWLEKRIIMLNNQNSNRNAYWATTFIFHVKRQIRTLKASANTYNIVMHKRVQFTPLSYLETWETDFVSLL